MSIYKALCKITRVLTHTQDLNLNGTAEANQNPLRQGRWPIPHLSSLDTVNKSPQHCYALPADTAFTQCWAGSGPRLQNH